MSFKTPEPSLGEAIPWSFVLTSLYTISVIEYSGHNLYKIVQRSSGKMLPVTWYSLAEFGWVWVKGLAEYENEWV